MPSIEAGGELWAAQLLAAFRTDLLEKYAGVDSVGVAESTTATFFTNLATPGPQVTLQSKGSRAWAWVSCRCWNTSNVLNQSLMGVSVTDDDGEVVAPSVAAALTVTGSTTQAGGRIKGMLIPFNIAPGTYTYTAQYRSGLTATSSFFDSRVLVVFAP